MFDNLKIFSQKLNTSFKITVSLPNDYDKNNHIYTTLFVVSGSNPFSNFSLNLEEFLINKNMLGIAIYPNLDIKKNTLLYNSFDETYNFARLYEEFIVFEVLPLLKEKYRIHQDSSNNYILGLNDTSILAYSLAYHYSLFSKIFLINFNFNNHKIFLSDLMSKFNPNIDFYINANDKNFSKTIVDRLLMFGAPKASSFNDIKDLEFIL